MRGKLPERSKLLVNILALRVFNSVVTSRDNVTYRTAAATAALPSFFHDLRLRDLPQDG